MKRFESYRTRTPVVLRADPIIDLKIMNLLSIRIFLSMKMTFVLKTKARVISFLNTDPARGFFKYFLTRDNGSVSYDLDNNLRIRGRNQLNIKSDREN